MTIDEAHQLLEQQLNLSSGYSRNSLRMLLSQVLREHGEEVAQSLITHYQLDQQYQIRLEGLMKF